MLDAAIRLDVFLPVMAEQRLMRGGQALEVGLPPMHLLRGVAGVVLHGAHDLQEGGALQALILLLFSLSRARGVVGGAHRAHVSRRGLWRPADNRSRRTAARLFRASTQLQTPTIDDPAASSEAPARLPIQTRRRHRAEPAWASI